MVRHNCGETNGEQGEKRRKKQALIHHCLADISNSFCQLTMLLLREQWEVLCAKHTLVHKKYSSIIITVANKTITLELKGSFMS